MVKNMKLGKKFATGFLTGFLIAGAIGGSLQLYKTHEKREGNKNG